MRGKQPNFLLVVLDATRADACSCYGNRNLTTPVLDELAADGVLFEQAISPAPWTLPALASVFTGLFPSQIDVYGKLKLDSNYPTLAQRLSQNGYATFGITNNSWLSAEFGLQRGFDQVHKQWQGWQTQHEVNKLVLLEKSHSSSWTKTMIQEMAKGNLLKNAVNGAFNRLIAYRHDLGASRILRPLSRWIESQNGPWFALVHYLEAHLVYKPPSKWAARFSSDLNDAKRWIKADQWRAAWRHIAGVERLSESDLRVWRELYQAEIAYADHHLGLLLDWLTRTQRLENTCLIVVADHGEHLGEHGLLNHQYSVYDALLRVPLVVHYPALLPRGQRVPHQVHNLDIFRTILDIAGIESTSSASRNLLAESAPRAFTVAEYGPPRTPHPRYLSRFGLEKKDLKRFQRGFTAIRGNTHKLIVGTDGSMEVYAWPEDPSEQTDLSLECPPATLELQALLQRWHTETGSTEGGEMKEDWEVDPDVAARLEALGYLG